MNRCLLLALSVVLALSAADAPPAGTIKTESFDRDPGWEGVNNRVKPARVTKVVQDFGHSATSHASKAKGEVGGRVWRSTTPAYYAARVAKTLDDRLSASGTFALTQAGGSTGAFFGWFGSKQPGGGRPLNSLGLGFDGENSGGRLMVHLITGTNKTAGKFVTPFIPGKYRPTPIRKDGTRYRWKLDYDPEANGGNGRFTFTITSDREKKEAWEGKPVVVDLPAGLRKEGATFDRFGLHNMMKGGGPLALWFGDLTLDGKPVDLSKEPGWVGSNNRVTFEDRVQTGAHDFGFSPKTNFAGGKAGEIGGMLWRVEKGHGYYADKVGPLSLDDRLEASGRVILKVGAPDSDAFLGWFTATKDRSPAEAGNFVGVHIGGPTRIGHYFVPWYTTGKGTTGRAKKGPILTIDKAFEWSVVYDPKANDGNGLMRVTLGEGAVELALPAGHRKEGARLDRFGFCTAHAGGSQVKVYVDDLKYTARR